LNQIDEKYVQNFCADTSWKVGTIKLHRRWDLREIGWKDVNWIELVQYMVQWGGSDINGVGPLDSVARQLIYIEVRLL
jgi:hypothetical protein